jgi:ElaB/YqjD/DUF883 family membrane-anchored ribosome-binding protein
MSTDIHTDPTINQLSEAAREFARRTADTARETVKRATATTKDVTAVVEDVAGDVTHATKDAARRATDTAKDMYQSVALKAGETLETSKEYVRRNPVPFVLGAVAFGAAIGYMLMMARRKRTYGERYVDEPLVAVREAILGAFKPVAHGVHKGYDSARDGAGKAMARVHGFGSGRTCDSLSHQIGRIGNNLKFW